MGTIDGRAGLFGDDATCICKEVWRVERALQGNWESSTQLTVESLGYNKTRGRPQASDVRREKEKAPLGGL